MCSSNSKPCTGGFGLQNVGHIKSTKVCLNKFCLYNMNCTFHINYFALRIMILKKSHTSIRKHHFELVLCSALLLTNDQLSKAFCKPWLRYCGIVHTIRGKPNCSESALLWKARKRTLAP